MGKTEDDQSHHGVSEKTTDKLCTCNSFLSSSSLSSIHTFLPAGLFCVYIYHLCEALERQPLLVTEKKKNYISNYYLIGRETPGSSSKYEHLSSYISGFCGAAFTGEASDLLMRSMGYALVTTTIIASTPVQILLLCFLSAGRHWRRHPRSPEGIQDLH